METSIETLNAHLNRTKHLLLGTHLNRHESSQLLTTLEDVRLHILNCTRLYDKPTKEDVQRHIEQMRDRLKEGNMIGEDILRVLEYINERIP